MINKVNDFNITRSPFFRRVFFFVWFLIVMLGIYYTLRGINTHFLPWDAPRGLARSLHIITGAIALIIGPIQFSQNVRRKWPKYHRYSGYTYIACIFLSTPLAILMAFRGFSPESMPAFFIWTTMWFLFTAAALYAALIKQFVAHKHFMIRSYVLTNGFVFTRIDEFLPFPLPEGADIHREPMVIMVVWIVPLLITEIFINWLPSLKKRKKIKK